MIHSINNFNYFVTTIPSSSKKDSIKTSRMRIIIPLIGIVLIGVFSVVQNRYNLFVYDVVFYTAIAALSLFTLISLYLAIGIKRAKE